MTTKTLLKRLKINYDRLGIMECTAVGAIARGTSPGTAGIYFFGSAVLALNSRYVVGWDFSGAVDAMTALKSAIDRSYNHPVYSSALPPRMYAVRVTSAADHAQIKHSLASRGADVYPCPPDSLGPIEHVEILLREFITEVSDLRPAGLTGVPKRCDFAELFAKWIDQYHLRVHPQTGIPPITAWVRDNVLQMLARTDSHRVPEQLDLTPVFAPIPRKGIIGYQGLAWRSAALALPAMQVRGDQKLIMVYDSSDLGYCWVAHPSNPEGIYKLLAVLPAYQNGLTFERHQHLHRQRGRQQCSNEPPSF